MARELLPVAILHGARVLGVAAMSRPVAKHLSCIHIQLCVESADEPDVQQGRADPEWQLYPAWPGLNVVCC